MLIAGEERGGSNYRCCRKNILYHQYVPRICICPENRNEWFVYDNMPGVGGYWLLEWKLGFLLDGTASIITIQNRLCK